MFRTTSYGATWSDASNGLPDVPVNAIHIDDRRTAGNGQPAIYAGTDIGVFRSDDGGGQWYPFRNGMPAVIVTSFTTTADGRLIAGTYGRGAYELVEQSPDPRRRAVRH